jgi:alpha-mannosidase
VLVQQMNTPEDTYNGVVDPSTLLRVWRNHADKQIALEALQPIGYGDGGGGPTEQMIQAHEHLKDFPVIPESRFTSVGEYFASALKEAEEKPPAQWVGELYLEYHRGTLTTQGRTKFLLRRAERGLVAAEVLGSLAWMANGTKPKSLEGIWRTLLINQFHDILPGSSIADVYRRTERELQEVVESSKAVADRALDSIASSLGTSEGHEGNLVFNPDLSGRVLRLHSDLPLEGGQRAEDGFVLCSDEIVAPLSVRVGRAETASAPAEATSRTLENRFVRVEFADDGTIGRIFDKRSKREVLSGRGNQLWAWRDQPREYDAWDIDEDYRRTGEEIVSNGSGEVIETGPHRSALRFVRKYRDSTIVQSVRLWANSARIDFRTRFDWHERRLLIQALFPVLVHSDHATFECAFGVQRRPTHRNTSWDAARFEVAAHRFVDLSEQGYGVALLNDGRYGHHAFGNELGISLLRSPTLPDRFADEGEHNVTYSLYPHVGGWFEGGVLAEAEDLNRPLYHRAVRTTNAHARSFLNVRGTACALAALKPAEDGSSLILRVYEPAGARGPLEIEPSEGWKLEGEVTLLEEPVANPSGGIGPFEIKSFRLTPVHR